SFYALASLIQVGSIFKNDSPNPQVPIEIQLATALYFLGLSGVSAIQGAAQLGIGEETTHLYCDQCIYVFICLLLELVTWPQP
ncbi:hypothetical protein C7212DRAFT_141604, partial [Tuber magnatum]